jgi:glycosyltransferase involved in cell wall biosynthesis
MVILKLAMRQLSRNGDVVVVIPAYRAATYLDATLASVAGQTAPPREVVLVDDGSDDSTAERATNWRLRLPIRVIVQAESDSPLIALLDADDVWLPDHLATLTALYRDCGGIISGDAFEWIPGRPLRRTYRRSHPIPRPKNQARRILEDNFVFVGAMFARSDYLAVGGFRDGFTGAEDWDLWIRLIREQIRVVGAPGPTVLYRRNPTGLTGSTLSYDRYIAVLAAAAEVCTDADQMRLIARRRSWFRARRDLAMAYDAARLGQTMSARRIASQVLTGPPRIALQALGVVVAPHSAQLVWDRPWARSRPG